jgi:hypothetical protein
MVTLHHNKYLLPQCSLLPKIFALIDFCGSLLIIRLIREICENVIYLAMTCFKYIIIIFVFSQIF